MEPGHPRGTVDPNFAAEAPRPSASVLDQCCFPCVDPNFAAEAPRPVSTADLPTSTDAPSSPWRKSPAAFERAMHPA